MGQFYRWRLDFSVKQKNGLARFFMDRREGEEYWILYHIRVFWQDSNQFLSNF